MHVKPREQTKLRCTRLQNVAKNLQKIISGKKLCINIDWFPGQQLRSLQKGAWRGVIKKETYIYKPVHYTRFQ